MKVDVVIRGDVDPGVAPWERAERILELMREFGPGFSAQLVDFCEVLKRKEVSG